MRKVAILGTGMVGIAIATKLVELDCQVMMGSRTADNERAGSWVSAVRRNAARGTFEDVAQFADVIFNCTKGENSIDAIALANTENFNGKILIDVSNPLNLTGVGTPVPDGIFRQGSLGEAIQNLLPQTYVVKTLNIVNCEVMVDAGKFAPGATMFMCGNDKAAKSRVAEILKSFGWNDIINLGGIEHAKSLELMLPIWLSTYRVTKNRHLGFKIMR